MPHIHTEPGQIDHTASAYVVLLGEGEPKLLLHMHRKLGVLLQPGGHIELHETPWQAIAHELSEETGYQLADVAVLQPIARTQSLPRCILHPVPFQNNTHTFGNSADHFHSDVGYLFTANERPSRQPAPGESNDLRWLTKQEIIDTPDQEIYEDTRSIAIDIFDVFLDGWEPAPASNFSLKLPKP